MIEELNEWGKRYGDSFKFLSGLTALALGLKGLVLPSVEAYFSKKGPAVVIKAMKLDPKYPGTEGRLIVELDKIRDCVIQRFSLRIIDREGLGYPAENTFASMVLPIQLNQVVVYNYTMPAHIQPGQATATAEAIYGHCRDGADPKEPVQTPMARVLVLGRTAEKLTN